VHQIKLERRPAKDTRKHKHNGMHFVLVAMLCYES
jgi:hypothetical protein